MPTGARRTRPFITDSFPPAFSDADAGTVIDIVAKQLETGLKIAAAVNLVLDDIMGRKLAPETPHPCAGQAADSIAAFLAW